MMPVGLGRSLLACTSNGLSMIGFIQASWTLAGRRRQFSGSVSQVWPPCRRRPRAEGVHVVEPSSRLWMPDFLPHPARIRQPSANQAAEERERSDEFGEWSEEFSTLCCEQLELLEATLPNIASGTVFFRREHPTTGALEFIPVATFPNDPRVWISHEGLGSAPVSSRVLPGGIPAVWILPDYPFLDRQDAKLGFVAADGTLCVPIMFSSVAAGTIVLRRPTSIPATRAWAEKDVARVRIVARTIALAAQLEGRWLAASQALEQDLELRQSLGELIRATMHQIRSPITALVTFGRVLLRRLPAGDENRSIAKSILVEGFRLDDLLRPLDKAGDRLSLPPGEANAGQAESTNGGRETGANNEGIEAEISRAPVETGSVIDLVRQDASCPQLFWLSDILAPVGETTAALAKARGRRFVLDIDEDAPPVMGHESSLREAVHNLLDNALKYTPRGGAIGLLVGPAEDCRDFVEVVVCDSGRGISEEEQDRVWEQGKRGTAGLESDISGSGLGLAIAKSLVEQQNGTLSFESPAPDERSEWLLGSAGGEEVDYVGPGSVFRITLRRPGT